ncbi:MAG: hypothetical protein L3J88_13380 [Gammaproteobacteria bacterium]|nr:hypothetical protein [Gammaproteobacteria bacterium]
MGIFKDAHKGDMQFIVADGPLGFSLGLAAKPAQFVQCETSARNAAMKAVLKLPDFLASFLASQTRGDADGKPGICLFQQQRLRRWIFVLLV